jgi:hypothetical protein
MSDERTARINQAVDQILDHISQHGPGALQQCLDGLKRKGWTPGEIEVVRVIVNRRLNASSQ